MSERVIRVTCCRECPYLGEYEDIEFCDSDDAPEERVTMIGGCTVEPDGPIPDWCPLEKPEPPRTGEEA